jgi:hypothetical protein
MLPAPGVRDTAIDSDAEVVEVGGRAEIEGPVMGKHEHTTTESTKIISFVAAPAAGDAAPGASEDQAANASMEELLAAPSPAGPASPELADRPMRAVGVLTAVVLAAFVVAGIAGALTHEPPAVVTSADAGAKPASVDPGAGKAKLDRFDSAGKTDKARSGRPAPSHVGLCRAYRSKVGDHPGKALRNPAFTSLISAAGGARNIAPYCVRVLGAKEDRDGKDDGDRRGNKKGHGKGEGQRGGKGGSEQGDNDRD